MASIGDIVDGLGAIKKSLEDSSSQVQSVAASTEEMATAQQSMDVTDKAGALQALHERLNSLAVSVDGLSSSVDDLVVAAQAIGGT